MGTPATANDYAVLGLRPAATPAEIETAFQQLALQHHPDRSADPRAAQRFQAILSAYERIRGSDPGRVYRVGEHQPEDDDLPRATHEFVPFDQPVAWTATVPAPTVWQRVSVALVFVQGAVAAAALFAAVSFWVTAAFGDQGRVDAFGRAPLCAVKQSDDCIAAGVSGLVDATVTRGSSVVPGDYPDALRIHVATGDIDVGISRIDSGVPFAGLQMNDTVTLTRWRGDIVGVGTPNGAVTTDLTPAVIQQRHKTNALIWLGIAVALAVRPVLRLIRWRRTRPAAEV